mgnify:CR=1 FL=1
MKITRYAMMLAAATGLLSACQKLDEVKAYDPDKVVAPVLHALPGEIVITPDNMGSTQTFTWDAADFGVRTQINYSIEASYNDGAKLVLFTGMNGTSSEQTYESLNNILALSVEDGGLGVPSGEPTDVDFYISATIGTDFEKFYSAPATVRMTVTTAERTYPQVWVIGDYCGWNFDNAQGLFCFSGDEVTYEAIVDLGEKAANGFKLSGEAGWNDACNWGTDGDAAAPETEAPSITLISSGGSGNIMVYSKRFYRFVFDRSTLTLSNKLSFNSMGIIGDATPGGWDTDTEMNFDTQKQRFWVDVTLTAGEFKFRADNDWAINFGGADGRLSQNGDNIKATAGNYRVYATLNNSAEITYELNAGDYGTGGGEAQKADGGDLIFAHKFKNFELELEWKISKGGNSGILYLAQEVEAEKNGQMKLQPIYISSPEYQVLDNENHPDAKLGVDGNRKSASLYDMIPAVPQNAKPFGEWNKAKIMVYKGTVVHGQNGQNVVEYHLWTPQWTEMLENSKFSSEKWPLAFELLNNCGGENHEGYIGLQDHGDDVWFRNIRVKILD